MLQKLLVIGCLLRCTPTESPKKASALHYQFSWPAVTQVRVTQKTTFHSLPPTQQVLSYVWHIGKGPALTISVTDISYRDSIHQWTQLEAGAFEVDPQGRFVRMLQSSSAPSNDQALTRASLTAQNQQALYWRQTWDTVAADWFDVTYRSDRPTGKLRHTMAGMQRHLIPHTTRFHARFLPSKTLLVAEWELGATGASAYTRGALVNATGVRFFRTLQLDPRSGLPTGVKEVRTIRYASGRTAKMSEEISLAWAR